MWTPRLHVGWNNNRIKEQMKPTYKLLRMLALEIMGKLSEYERTGDWESFGIATDHLRDLIEKINQAIDENEWR